MQTIKFPPWATRPADVADILRTDATGGLADTGKELLSMIDDHAELQAEHERLGEILIDFGALAPDDEVTGLLDLLEILLPPRERS